MSAIRILLVEDDSDDRWIFERALERVGSADVVLTVAENGVEALGQLEETGPFDLALIDLQMPTLGGMKLIETLRNHDTWAVIPIIVMTTSRERAVINEAYRRGCNAYLVKPMEFRGLVSMLTTMLDYWINHVTWPDYDESEM